MPPWPVGSQRSLASFEDCPLFARALRGQSTERPSPARKLCCVAGRFPIGKHKLEACNSGDVIVVIVRLRDGDLGPETVTICP